MVARMNFLSSLIIFFSVLFVFSFARSGATDGDRQVYIIYMGALPDAEYSAHAHHFSILKQVLGSSSAAVDALVCSYKRSFNGFAAKLTYQEQQRITRMGGVVSVFPSRTHKLHTTRSWDFLGFPETVQRNLTVESDIIIGVLDTGAWPESESFSDEGFGPPPKKWKGICQRAGNFTCNKKLIGARSYPYFPNKTASARDFEGHGTHTASTAAGRKVNGVSFFGLAGGNARGAVPSARIAVYKVCWENGCTDESVLAGFDDAIADGVDIISASLGSSYQASYNQDSVSIGSFHAMQKGILLSQSAGNDGPSYFSLSSMAPWVLTVAASTTDRRIVDKFMLGDGTTFLGSAINTFKSMEKMVPLIYGAEADVACSGQAAAGDFKERSVNGSIVFCDFLATDGGAPLEAGAAGLVAQDTRLTDFSFIYALPSAVLDTDNGLKVKSYINATREPQATIARSEAVHNSKAPQVVSFSSRGPNTVSKDILKPDICAPGAEILAAFSPMAPLTHASEDKRSVKYNIVSGTSMACPHATGAAAYVKSFHPNWSPAAIKSALMTTATPMDSSMKEFDYGAGFMNPEKAKNPGLVYDAREDDYIHMLCSEGYDSAVLQLITGHNTTCPEKIRATKDLNYPSMTISITAGVGRFMANFRRTVTNVGSANSTYKASVKSQSQLKVRVRPDVLQFEEINDKQTFVVMVSGMLKEMSPSVSMVANSLVWSDGVHKVRSPIVVYSGGFE